MDKGDPEKTMGNPLSGFAESVKKGYFFLEDRYYAVLDKINKYVPIYKVIDPIDKVVPSFLLFLLLLFLLVLLFLFISFAAMHPEAIIQVVDTKGAVIEGAQVDVTMLDSTETFFTNASGEVSLALASAEADAQLSLSKQGFDSIERAVTLVAGETLSITMHAESIIGPIPVSERKKTVKVVDGTTNNLITKQVTLTFECSGPVSPPDSQTDNTGEFIVVMPDGCSVLTATAECDGYQKKSKGLSYETNYIILSPNVTEIFGTMNVTVRDSEGNPLPDALVRVSSEPMNTEVGNQSTTQSGAAFFEDLRPGTYSVSVSLADGRNEQKTGVTVTGGQTTNLSITLPSLGQDDPVKKLFLLMLDEETFAPIQNVDVFIYREDDVLVDSTKSDSNGLVEKQFINPDDNYLLLLSHADYVTKILPGISLKNTSDRSPETIMLARASIEPPDPTSAEVVVTVTDEIGGPVEEALVNLYSEEHPGIPLRYIPGSTAEDGTYTFTNVEPGSYFARARTIDNSAEGISETASVLAGETLPLNVVLILGFGTVDATVFDSESLLEEPVAGAIVQFLDSEDLSTLLSTCTTDSEGECSSEPISSDKFVYVKVVADGFMPAFSENTVDIVSHNTSRVSIGLVHESSVVTDSSLDLELRKFCTDRDCLHEASRISSDDQSVKSYYAEFWLILSEDTNYSEIIQHVRVGPDTEINLPRLEYEIKIGRVEDSLWTSAVLSNCWNNDSYNPFTNPTECTADSDAKQANISFPNLRGKLVVPVVIKFDIEPGLEDGEELQIHYRAKANSGGGEVLTPEKVRILRVNEAFCDSGGFAWAFDLILPDGNTTALDTGAVLNDVNAGLAYAISHWVYNCSGRNFSEASLTAQNNEPEAISFNPEEPLEHGPVSVGESQSFSFLNDTVISGQTPIYPMLGTDYTEIEYALQASSQVSSSQVIPFEVIPEAERAMDVAFVPDNLPPTRASLIGHVNDTEEGFPLEDALVTLTLREGQVWSDRTNESGRFSFSNIPELEGLETVTLRVSKAGYTSHESEINVRSGEVPVNIPNPALNCVSVEKAGVSSEEIAISFAKNTSNPASDSFVVKNTCSVDVMVHLESELVFTPSEDFELKSKETKTVTIKAKTVSTRFGLYQGEYALYLSARYASEDELAGFYGPLHTVRVYVTDPNSCFRLSNPDGTGMKSTFDVSSGTDEGLVVNDCFVYFPDLTLPRIEEAHDYSAVEGQFSLLFEAPKAEVPTPVEIIRKLDPNDSSLFDSDGSMVFDIVPNGGYVFVDWVDFLIGDNEHEGGDRHRVKAEIYKNVWENITAPPKIPYIANGSDLDQAEETYWAQTFQPWIDYWTEKGNERLVNYYTNLVEKRDAHYCDVGMDWVDYWEGLKQTHPVYTDICDYWIDYWKNWANKFCRRLEERLDFPIVDNEGWVDTDVTYSYLSFYDESLEGLPMWQGQHTVCKRNITGFSAESEPCEFLGDQVTPYTVEMKADKIKLEINGSQGSEVTGVKWRYLNTDGDHEGKIAFDVRNNSLMGESFALLEAEDTTGVGFVRDEDLTVNVDYYVRGITVNESASTRVEEDVVIPPGHYLGVSVSEEAEEKFGVFESLEEAHSALNSSQYSSLQGFDIKFSTRQPTGFDSTLNYYLYGRDGWEQGVDYVELNSLNLAKEFSLTTLDELSGVPIKTSIVAIENEGDTNMVVEKVSLDYLLVSVDSAKVSSREIMIPVGETQASFPSPLISKDWRDYLQGNYDLVEYLVESDTAEAVAYFEGSKSSSTEDKAESVVVATSSPEKQANTRSERFHVRLLGPTNDQCVTASGGRGNTGMDAMPRVLFDWQWEDIGLDACSLENPSFIYCDPTQFTITLVKRLEDMRKLSEFNIEENWIPFEEKKGFYVYLISDSYTQDFRNDFVEFYRDKFLSADLLSEPNHPWEDYLKDPDRLVFDTANARLESDDPVAPGSKKISAGLYEVYLKIDFEEEYGEFFYSQGQAVPTAKITVIFTKMADPLTNNPFYYLPFNGEVGVSTANGRQGYGLAFLNENTPLVLYSELGGGFYDTEWPEGKAAGKSVATVRIDDFYSTNIKDAGMILKVSQELDQIDFLPSIATPVLLKMSTSNGNAEAYYFVREENGALVQPQSNFISQWEVTGSTIGRQGMSCLDFYGNPLGNRVQDKPAPQGSCAEQAPGSYGFSYPNVMEGEELFLQAVFYAPAEKIFHLKKSCVGNYDFYSSQALEESATISLSVVNASARVISIKDLFDMVGEEYVCVSSDSQNFYFWWNPQKMLSELDDVKESINPAWEQELGCSEPA